MWLAVLLFLGVAAILYAIYWLVSVLAGRDPDTGKKIDTTEYLNKIRERDRIRSGKLAPEEMHILADYLSSGMCIGLSPRCTGRKSRTAVVCSMCYRAQSRDNPIGFAQSGGGPTKEQLLRKVLQRWSELQMMDTPPLSTHSIDKTVDDRSKRRAVVDRTQEVESTIISVGGRYASFVTPVLKTIDGLGGTAWLSDVEQEFYARFHSFLDPAVDWRRTTGNHNKELWQDCCGSRVLYHQLKPKGYVTVERHGNKGSILSITRLGREKIGEVRETVDR